MDDRARHQWIATYILPHEPEVRGWLRRHVRSLAPSDIDDLVQEAYARLWLSEFTRISNARGYLFTVIRNLLLEGARRARIVPMERMGEIEMLRIPSDEPELDRRVGARQELERLQRIVATLPEQSRRAFQLHKFQCLSQKEVAHQMNIAEKTVEKHLASALVRVLNALKEDANEDAGNASLRISAGLGGHVAEQSKD